MIREELEKQPEPHASQTAAPQPDYNTVFQQLVSEADPAEKQLIGLVAYGLYKVSKREWVMTFRAENDGNKPSEADQTALARGQTNTILDGYRSQAAELVAGYANAVLEGERPRIYKEAIAGSFMRSFWPSLAASTAFAAILSLIVIIAAINGVGLPVQLNVTSDQIAPQAPQK